MVGDKLEGILVSRYDHRLPACGFVDAGDGTDQVVGLPPLQLIPGDGHGVQHLPDNGQLSRQLLRHGLALGLIALVGQVPEGGRLQVEGTAQGLRLLLLHQLQQNVEKAEHGVGGDPVPGGQGPDPIKGPIQDGIAVNDHELHKKPSLKGT